MAQVTVTCKLAKYDIEACLDHLRQQSLDIDEISCEEVEADGDILQWIFRTSIGTVDILR